MKRKNLRKRNCEKRKRGFCAAITVSMCVTLLSGCSKDLDFSTEVSETALVQLPNGLGIVPERWEEQFKTTSRSGVNAYRININADVVVPQTGSMSVIEVSETEFDAAYKGQMIDNIFGDTEIYYNDDVHLPWDKLDERIKYYQGRIREVWYRDETDPGYLMNQRMNQYWENKIAACEEAKNNAPSNYQLAKNFEADSYLGERDGIFYTITFEDNWSYENRIKSVVLEPENWRDVCPEEYQNADELEYWLIGLEDESAGVNQCSLTSDEARTLAEQFLEKLNLPHMIEFKYDNLEWCARFYGDSIQEKYYGYAYVYHPEEGGVDLTDFCSDYNVDWEKAFVSGEDPYSLESSVTVLVTDKGVIGMEIQNPYTINSIVEQVDCLEVERVQNIIRNEIKENPDQYGYPSHDGVLYNLFELGYLRIRDSATEKRYSYVPAWKLVKKGNVYDMILEGYEIYINAIDGSVILIEDVI